MGKVDSNIEVYGINKVFDAETFANNRLCDVFGVIDEMKGRYRPSDYSVLENNCQMFVKEFIFLLNNKKYPVFVSTCPVHVSGGMMNYYDDRLDEYTRGGYINLYLNGYYLGYWSIKEKKFVKKWFVKFVIL